MWLVLMLASVMFALTSCASLTDFVETDVSETTYCRIARPISWSSQDTDQTIREVKEHNAVGVELCGWAP
jgi:hypothetical protein